MQRNSLRLVSIAAYLLLCSSPPLFAGPLDRSDMGPRVNPASNDMLRVPGVVGMDYQSALASLQQAGLNPRVHTIRKVMKKYAGQEGMVVKQLPLPGGVAMLGSSVSITIYAPGNLSASPNYPPDTDAGSSYPDDGTGDAGPSFNPSAMGSDGSNAGGYAPDSAGSDTNSGSGPAQGPAANGKPVKYPATPVGGWHLPNTQDSGSTGRADSAPTHVSQSPRVPFKPEGPQSLLTPHQVGQ